MQLLIRSANHKQLDFPMTVDDSMTTIRDIKCYLSQNYPDKPDKSFMRMIFQGHLLADEKMVADVFNGDQDCYVVHLVCLPKIKTDPIQTATTEQPDASSNARSASDSASASRSAPVNNASAASASSASSSTQPDNSLPSAFTNIRVGQIPVAGNAFNWTQPALSTSADVAFAEWYTRYYSAWLMYLSAMQTQVISGMNGNPMPIYFGNLNGNANGPVENGAHMAAAAAPAEDGRANAVAPANNRAPDNRGLNAAGAGGALFDDEDDDGRARDLLDWVYIAVRAGILLSLIYLYSSIPRIVALIALLGSVWLLRAAIGGLQNNRQRHAQQQQQAQQPQQAPALQQDQAQPAQPAENTNPANNGTQETPNAAPPGENQAQPPANLPAVARIPTYRIVFSAIAGFFLSLFPDAPGLHPHMD